MTLTLTLPAPLERRLAEHAKATGQTVEAAAAALLDQSLPRQKTFAEVCEPFRRAFEASGMTEEQLDELVEQARQEVWEEQQRERSDR